MSLRPQPVAPVPDETARVARAAFPKGNLYMLLRDEFGTLATDEEFAPLFPKRGQPAAAPWRLALVTVFQFIEGLPDRAYVSARRSSGLVVLSPQLRYFSRRSKSRSASAKSSSNRLMRNRSASSSKGRGRQQESQRVMTARNLL